MQTIDEMKAYCHDVGKRIEKAIAEGKGLVEFFTNGYCS